RLDVVGLARAGEAKWNSEANERKRVAHHGVLLGPWALLRLYGERLRPGKDKLLWTGPWHFGIDPLLRDLIFTSEGGAHASPLGLCADNGFSRGTCPCDACRGSAGREQQFLGAALFAVPQEGTAEAGVAE